MTFRLVVALVLALDMLVAMALWPRIRKIQAAQRKTGEPGSILSGVETALMAEELATLTTNGRWSCTVRMNPRRSGRPS